jgi:hypothetical protein
MQHGMQAHVQAVAAAGSTRTPAGPAEPARAWSDAWLTMHDDGRTQLRSPIRSRLSWSTRDWRSCDAEPSHSARSKGLKVLLTGAPVATQAHRCHRALMPPRTPTSTPAWYCAVGSRRARLALIPGDRYDLTARSPPLRLEPDAEPRLPAAAAAAARGVREGAGCAAAAAGDEGVLGAISAWWQRCAWVATAVPRGAGDQDFEAF